MFDPTQPLVDEDFAFIRNRGALYGGGGWPSEAKAAAGFADGWARVSTMLHMKGLSEADARKAAQVFTDAAWAEWRKLAG